jgi:hypothetical protein
MCSYNIYYVYQFDGWVVKQLVKAALNNSFAWMYAVRAYHFLELCMYTVFF